MEDCKKSLVNAAVQMICVAYTDEFSINNNSLNDLEIGCMHGVVSSNQVVLKKAMNGSFVVITAQSGHFVIGVLGDHIDVPCRLWSTNGGHTFKYARNFIPITDILTRASVKVQWDVTCEVYEVPKNPNNAFHSRWCGYGSWYMDAMKAALNLGVIPLRKTTRGTRTTFA